MKKYLLVLLLALSFLLLGCNASKDQMLFDFISDYFDDYSYTYNIPDVSMEFIEGDLERYAPFYTYKDEQNNKRIRSLFMDAPYDFILKDGPVNLTGKISIKSNGPTGIYRIWDSNYIYHYVIDSGADIYQSTNSEALLNTYELDEGDELYLIFEFDIIFIVVTYDFVNQLETIMEYDSLPSEYVDLIENYTEKEYENIFLEDAGYYYVTREDTLAIDIYAEDGTYVITEPTTSISSYDRGKLPNVFYIGDKLYNMETVRLKDTDNSYDFTYLDSHYSLEYTSYDLVTGKTGTINRDYLITYFKPFESEGETYYFIQYNPITNKKEDIYFTETQYAILNSNFNMVMKDFFVKPYYLHKSGDYVYNSHDSIVYSNDFDTIATDIIYFNTGGNLMLQNESSPYVALHHDGSSIMEERVLEYTPSTVGLNLTLEDGTTVFYDYASDSITTVPYVGTIMSENSLDTISYALGVIYVYVNDFAGSVQFSDYVSGDIDLDLFEIDFLREETTDFGYTYYFIHIEYNYEDYYVILRPLS